MLKPEQARQELERLAVPDAVKRRHRKVTRLLGAAGKLGDHILGPYVAPYAYRANVDQAALARALDDLGDQRRTKLFKTMHPTLGDLLAAGWNDLRRDPYTAGYERRAFRAPQRPDLTAVHRLQWVRSVVLATTAYEQPVEWFAAWAAHLTHDQQPLGRLLAVAIDHGNNDVFDTLVQTVAGEHPVGQISRPVITGLLAAGRADGWEQVERLLLAAQREEGLRQVILESADLAHPDAFSRMLRLIAEHNLARFAAVVRAAGVWLGEGFEVTDRKLVDELLSQLAAYRDDPDARRAALAGEDAGGARLALWAQAHVDAPTACAQADGLLGHASPDVRLAAMSLVYAAQLQESGGALARGVDDDDLRVAAVAFAALQHRTEAGDEVYAALRRLIGRLPRPATLQVGTWKPVAVTLNAAEVADAVTFHTGQRSPRELDDLLEHMSPSGRLRYAALLAEDPHRHRDALLALLGDRSETVRGSALRALASVVPSADEAVELEALLTRKSSDLRRAVLELLLRQDDDALVASIRRLLQSAAAQRRAGEELLEQVRAQGRASARVARLTQDLGDAVPERATPETPPAVSPPAVIEDDARTPAVQPEPPAAPIIGYTDGVARVLRSLDAWLAEHRDAEVRIEEWGGSTHKIVGDLAWIRRPNLMQSWDEQRAHFPLAELVDPWWHRTAPQLSAGGAEVLLAAAAVDGSSAARPHYSQLSLPNWAEALGRRAAAADVVAELSYGGVSAGLLRWLAVRELRPEWVDAVLDGLQDALAAVPRKGISGLPRVAHLFATRHTRTTGDLDWRAAPAIGAWWDTALMLEHLRPEQWTAEQRGRLWRLVRFLDEPQGAYAPTRDGRELVKHPYGVPQEYPRRPSRQRPPIGLAARAVRDGAATEADVVDLLVGEQVPDDDGHSPSRVHRPLADLTRRRGHPLLTSEPWLAGLVHRIRDVIVDAELSRGELPTPFSTAALQLRSTEGADTVLRLLAGLGSDKLVRGYIWSGDARPSVFSKLIRGCFPAPDDTPERFAAAARDAGVKQSRLLDLAVYAPQWAPFVEAAVEWQFLTEAVHWLHAHTKDDQWQVDEDVRDEWRVQTHQRTPLQPDDLVAGAVDVAWFSRLRDTLGDERFNLLLKAARYASSSGGHKRAELFARALRGDVSATELLTRITEKRHQDSVRAYGLLPLPDGDEVRQSAVLERYETLHRWRQGGRKFGQQRRTSEALAVRIGLANLARTAGYRDPQRLQWAMEAEAVRDLADGPVSASEGDVIVSLSIDNAGTPVVEVRRGERHLKSVPKAVAKAESIVAVTGRASRLRKQTGRMRSALEEGAVRGDTFSPDELAALFAHPMLAPMLDVTVVTTAEGVLGFPGRDARVLLGPDGQTRPADGSPLRLAHAVDLLESDEWHDWQRVCFTEQIRQPFKQVFRELYVLTDAERADGTRSQRYAGQQVKPQQAAALFGARGWIVQREEGALRTFHDERITVVVDVLGGWSTPADVEGMALEDVVFLPVGGGRPLPLTDVPPRLFSEVMRDIDLVVSVAHAGGVDPEASASTIEVRGALVRETAELLSLDNVELTDHHALVTGQLGSYSVHLGSGTVHRRPGNAVCIVPVGSQHRGRLFLPFVDDDPRTAEVVSKVVMLARDSDIRDPTVLEQLRA